MPAELGESAVEPKARADRSWPHVLRLGAVELVVAAIGYLVYSLSTGAAYGHKALAVRNAARLVDLERRVDLLHERQIQSLILPYRWLVQLFNAIYIWGHLPLIIVVLLWLFLLHRRRYRVIRNALLISGGIALILFYVVPVAPPRLIPSLHLQDTAALISPVYDTVEPKVFFNPYAALPSMHIGWDLLLGIALVRCSPHAPLRAFGVILPIGMFAAVVMTGNHYILDGVAGAAVGLTGLAIALWFEHLRLGWGISGAALVKRGA